MKHICKVSRLKLKLKCLTCSWTPPLQSWTLLFLFIVMIYWLFLFSNIHFHSCICSSHAKELLMKAFGQISNFDENLRREEHLKFVHSIILVPKSNAQKSCSLCFLLCQAPPYILSKKLEIKRQKDTAWSPLAPKCVEISSILFGAASEHFWGKTILFHITSFLKFLI